MPTLWPVGTRVRDELNPRLRMGTIVDNSSPPRDEDASVGGAGCFYHIAWDDGMGGAGIIHNRRVTWIIRHAQAHDRFVRLAPVLVVGSHVIPIDDFPRTHYGPGVVIGIDDFLVYVHHENGRYATSHSGISCAAFGAAQLELIDATPSLTDRPAAKRYGPFKPIAKRLPA